MNEWMDKQEFMDTSELVFLDESSVNIGMTRAYGRVEKNERVVDYVPDERYKTETIISTVRLNGETAPLIIDGAINGDIFKAYLEICLIPTLHPGDILVMDNHQAIK